MERSRLMALLAGGALLALAPGPLRAQSAADSAAIRATALDYVEGWYAGDAARMERALHPDLAKRIMRRRDGDATLEHMTAETLVQYTRMGGGRSTPPAEQQKEVRILDVFGNAASVRATMAGWIDYLHLAKAADDHWVIVNVLWELKPRA